MTVADDKSCGTCQAEGMDEQAEQNNVVHLLMVPKREPVKIGNFRRVLSGVIQLQHHNVLISLILDIR